MPSVKVHFEYNFKVILQTEWSDRIFVGSSFDCCLLNHVHGKSQPKGGPCLQLCGGYGSFSSAWITINISTPSVLVTVVLGLVVILIWQGPLPVALFASPKKSAWRCCQSCNYPLLASPIVSPGSDRAPSPSCLITSRRLRWINFVLTWSLLLTYTICRGPVTADTTHSISWCNKGCHLLYGRVSDVLTDQDCSHHRPLLQPLFGCLPPHNRGNPIIMNQRHFICLCCLDDVFQKHVTLVWYKGGFWTCHYLQIRK